jgi:hypothetical protein
MGKPLFVFIYHGLPARPGRSPDNVVALVVKELSVMRARLGALLLAANRAHAANLSQGGPRIGCARTYRSRLRAFSVAGDGNVLGLAFLAGYGLISNHLHLIGTGELFRVLRISEVWGGGNLRAQPIATRCALAASVFRAERPAAKKVCTW